MQKVLLVHHRPTEPSLYINTLPPLGTLGMVSYLRSKGFEAKGVDCNIDNLSEDSIIWADVIGFTVTNSNVVNSIETASRIKEKHPEKKIVAGGPYITSYASYFIKKPYFDAIITGEGEITFLDYLKANVKTNVKGLYLMKDGIPFFTGTRERVKDLDIFPFPALGDVDIKKYNCPMKKRKPISSIITSRGCPYGCIFCYHPLGRKWTYRSAKNVVDEIEWQVNKFGVREICVVDDNFTLDIKRAEKICDLIIERGIDIRLQLWGGIRVDRVNEALIKKLKGAGCWMAAIAPETGNPETLKKIKKVSTLDQAIKVRKWLKESKICTYAFFMVGFPWETEEEIKKTIEFAKKLDAEFTQFSRVLPFKGTELYDMIGIKENEDDIMKEKGLFYGLNYKVPGLSDEKIQKLIKKAYRDIYLNPIKMVKLLRILSIRNIFDLFVYSILTKSI